ncbi:MAG: 16S rRNA (cytidine(1402)-2'-O)-methyltransferase [Rhodospirillaceae bacterium]|nr:16S rRNA (cytidine(1402)-2'-O)-methyltransferase [Rhodospirillaceae bacterium]MCY4238438.1 16S rRNA (cytidine(1402)-2'-O)-methyltransferase [Rhodospirillaceae bacterium]
MSSQNPGRPAVALVDPVSSSLEPGLYLVATPIGNLRDITLRALDTLALADFIVCEDTRITRKLLAQFQINTPVRSYNDHNAARKRPSIVAALDAEKRVALVSDAGSPLVSDPGYKLVREAIAAGHRVEAVPGPTAVIAALQVSGLPTNQFRFAGFLAARGSKRREQLSGLSQEMATLVFYETGPRLAASLTDMVAILGDRSAAVTRELTKLHEEVVRGKLGDLIHRFQAPPKGEIVVLVAGTSEPVADADAIDAMIHKGLQTGESTRSIADAVAAETGARRRDVYQRTLALAQAGVSQDELTETSKESCGPGCRPKQPRHRSAF